MSISNELDRRIELSEKIMSRLDNGEKLSKVLNQVQLLMQLSEEKVIAALIDLLSHGIENMPYQGVPFTDDIYKKAGQMYCRLCCIEDISKLDVDEVLSGKNKSNPSRRDFIITKSVYEMENFEKPDTKNYLISNVNQNLYFQQGVYYNNVQSTLNSLRSYIYKQIGIIWDKSINQKNRVTLLGQNYELITNRLSLLETTVGNQLSAAIDNLFSENPANWSLCALGCRQVIIKLGIILWKESGEQYKTLNGKNLDVGKEREKNRLFAYIDYHIRKSDEPTKRRFNEAKKLVKTIYDEGSRGKSDVRKENAQALLVDTFHFVDLLDQLTGLIPVDNIVNI